MCAEVEEGQTGFTVGAVCGGQWPMPACIQEEWASLVISSVGLSICILCIK